MCVCMCFSKFGVLEKDKQHTLQENGFSTLSFHRGSFKGGLQENSLATKCVSICFLKFN